VGALRLTDTWYLTHLAIKRCVIMVWLDLQGLQLTKQRAIRPCCCSALAGCIGLAWPGPCRHGPGGGARFWHPGLGGWCCCMQRSSCIVTCACHCVVCIRLCLLVCSTCYMHIHPAVMFGAHLRAWFEAVCGAAWQPAFSQRTNGAAAARVAQRRPMAGAVVRVAHAC
jgi:hypothetical protein